MRASDDRGLGDVRMIDERALDFHRAEPMSGHVQHVVHATEQPVEAVVIAACAVAGEIDAVGPAAPVRLHEALGIAVDPAQHRRPRASSARAVRRRSRRACRCASRISAEMPGNGCVAEPGFVLVMPGQRRDHDHAGFGLPPRVDDRAALAADVVVIPHPGFRIDRLANRAEQAQR